MSQLISDVEALTALKNGEDVEYLEDDNKWNLIDKEFVVISALIDCKLRLKARTITINGVEIDKPSENISCINGDTICIKYSDANKASRAYDVLVEVFNAR